MDGCDDEFSRCEKRVGGQEGRISDGGQSKYRDHQLLPGSTVRFAPCCCWKKGLVATKSRRRKAWLHCRRYDLLFESCSADLSTSSRHGRSNPHPPVHLLLDALLVTAVHGIPILFLPDISGKEPKFLVESRTLRLLLAGPRSVVNKAADPPPPPSSSSPSSPSPASPNHNPPLLP